MQQLTPGANMVLSGHEVTVTLDYALDAGALDVTAYLLDAQTAKVRGDADMIFYGQPQTANRSVVLECLSGKAVLKVNTAAVDAGVGKIAVCATIDGAANLSVLRQLQMRLAVNGQDSATAQADMRQRSEAALIVLELYRYKDSWKCRWVEQGFNGGLKPLAEHFGVDIADEPTPAPAAKPEPTPPPKINLSKITLDKQNSSVSLAKKRGGFGKISINLNWNQRPQSGGGFLNRLMGNKGIDLDLGAMIRLRNGQIDLVQALGNRFGSLTMPPYVQLAGDDRTGAQSEGEWLHVNGQHWQDIEQVVVYCFIYEGVPNWAATDGVVRINVPDQAPIEIQLTEGRNKMNMCGVVTLNNHGGNIQVQRVVQYFAGHRELDRHFGYGFKWQAGRK